MGNDLTSDQKFMAKYNHLAAEFIKETPLFNPHDIEFPLSTHGMKIVDAKGRRVKLAGGNWSGGHLCRECVDGLECRPLRDIAKDIKYKFRMNCIRLTYSLQLYFDNSVIKEKYLKANPELIGKTAMEIFDFTVQTLTDVGLMVILNNHTSTSQWCCSNDDGDGLWWSYKYPENMFFQCAEEFARRYKDNPLVIGMDLRNELRKANGLEASWGDNNPLTDWRRAASICAEKVLKIAPHWLIIVSGLNYQLDLTPIFTHPLKLSVQNKLVYSGHLYSFSWPPSWASFSYQAFKKKLFNSQFFIRGLGYPILLGEFGNNKRDTLWNYLIKYMRQTDVDWTYWPIDGFKCEPNDPEKDQTYGIFTNDFKNIRNPDIFNDLMTIAAPKNIELFQVKKYSLKEHSFEDKKSSNKQNNNLRKQQEGTCLQKEEQKEENSLKGKTKDETNEKGTQDQKQQEKYQTLSEKSEQPPLVNDLRRSKSQNSVNMEINPPSQISHYHSEQISMEQILSRIHGVQISQKKTPLEINLLPNQPRSQIKDKKEQKPEKKTKIKIFGGHKL